VEKKKRGKENREQELNKTYGLWKACKLLGMTGYAKHGGISENGELDSRLEHNRGELGVGSGFRGHFSTKKLWHGKGPEKKNTAG